MGNLRDQLQKAKLLSKKEAKRLAHEERVHRKEAGREGLEAEQLRREEELRRLQDDERRQRQQVEAARERERQERAEVAACEEILRREVRAPAGGGQARFYFALADGRIPSLALREPDRFELLGGAACLVRTGNADAHAYGLLSIAHARRVRACLPERIAWCRPGALDG